MLAIVKFIQQCNMLPGFKDWFAALDKASIKAITKFPCFDVLEIRLSKGNNWVMIDTKDFRVFLRGTSKQGKQLQALFAELPKQTRRLEVRVVIESGIAIVQTKPDELVWYSQDEEYEYVCHLGKSQVLGKEVVDRLLDL